MTPQRVSRRSAIAAGVVAALMAVGPACAQNAPPKPVKDYKAAPAGNYAIDVNHTAIVARTPHMGFSYEVFRFTKVTGTLQWDPAAPASNKLEVTVDPKSITTPVPGFADELAGEKFLNAGKFPTATFVSKAFRPTDASHGKVDGDLTLMGVTKPITFDVELVGAGKGFRSDVIGARASTEIHPNDFGLAPPFFGPPIDLTIDLEFDRQP